MYTSKVKLAIIPLLMLVMMLVGYKLHQSKVSPLVIQVKGDPYHTKQYAEANNKILDKIEKKVVLAGDSMIYGWKFPDTVNGYLLVNRGINGETTDALIGRFNKDVIQIKPE
jgi:hypothetical protein